MEKKTLSKELFEKILKACYLEKFAGNLDDWKTEWFLGWLSLDVNCVHDAVIEINMDSDKFIVFFLVYKGDCTPEQVEFYIRGIMQVLAPDMYSEDTMDEQNGYVLTFQYANSEA